MVEPPDPLDARPYLEQELRFLPDRIEVAQSGVQVMMAWERPIVTRMAEVVALRRGDVLEIGFGMGLSCDAVQACGPRSHTIVEAHPQIIERAQRWAAHKPGVTIIPGCWQDVLDRLDTYDGVAFDVFGGEGQRDAFFARLDDLLRPGGVATLWLGDERELPAPLAQRLTLQGFEWRFASVSAVPDERCTYSRSNAFVVPVIRRVLERADP